MHFLSSVVRCGNDTSSLVLEVYQRPRLQRPVTWFAAHFLTLSVARDWVSLASVPAQAATHAAEQAATHAAASALGETQSAERSDEVPASDASLWAGELAAILFSAVLPASTPGEVPEQGAIPFSASEQNGSPDVEPVRDAPPYGDALSGQASTPGGSAQVSSPAQFFFPEYATLRDRAQLLQAA